METCPSGSTDIRDDNPYCFVYSSEFSAVKEAELRQQYLASIIKQDINDRETWHPGELKLVVVQGKFPGMKYLLDEPNMVVGRHDDQSHFYPDIDLSDQEENTWTISLNHARIIFRDGILHVVDLESKNGTSLNTPKRITSHKEVPIKPGDLLTMGTKIILTVEEHKEP